MKILLIVPTYHYKTRYPELLSVSDFPSGLAYIASYLEQAGHQVYGLNLNNIMGYATAYNMINNSITCTLEDINPDFVGLGGLCIDYKFLKDAIGIIREHSKAKIVLGGGIVTNDAEFIFNTLKPDYAIEGEGEEPFTQLVNKQPENTIPNLWRWVDQESNLVATMDGSTGYHGKVTDFITLSAKGIPIPYFTYRNFHYQNVNKLPFPDWESFGVKNMVDNYSYATRVLYRYSRTHPRPFIIVTARGCPFHCTFCKKHTEGYRPRSIENIMSEIALNYEKYKFNILIIQDELFAVNKERMRDFCQQLIANKKTFHWDFDWLMQTHANSKLDLETLKLAKESGLFVFSYGLESASPIVLKSMKKHIKPAQIVEAIELANKTGVGFAGNLLFGDPAETEETIQETMKFYFQYGLDLATLFLTFVSPYPGSELFDYCIEKGIIKDKLDYYEHIDENIWNMTQMPDAHFSEWAKFIIGFEQSYMMFKTANAHQCKKLASLLYEIHANCPFCGEECTYELAVDEQIFGRCMVPLCQHCNKRIRINIPMELKDGN